MKDLDALDSSDSDAYYRSSNTEWVGYFRIEVSGSETYTDEHLSCRYSKCGRR